MKSEIEKEQNYTVGKTGLILNGERHKEGATVPLKPSFAKQLKDEGTALTESKSTSSVKSNPTA